MTDLRLTSHLTIKATKYSFQPKGSSRNRVHCSVAACVKYKYITTLTHTKYPNRIKIIMKAAKSICSNNQRTHSSVKIFFYLILIYCIYLKIMKIVNSTDERIIYPHITGTWHLAGGGGARMSLSNLHPPSGSVRGSHCCP